MEYPKGLDDLVRAFGANAVPVSGVPASHDHGPHGHGHDAPSVRAFEYRGHQVRIVTRYEVTIDGEPWNPPLQVHQDGSVTYHGLPQYVSPSAVEVVEAVIDQSVDVPEEVRAAVRAVREGA